MTCSQNESFPPPVFSLSLSHSLRCARAWKSVRTCSQHTSLHWRWPPLRVGLAGVIVSVLPGYTRLCVCNAVYAILARTSRLFFLCLPVCNTVKEEKRGERAVVVLCAGGESLSLSLCEVGNEKLHLQCRSIISAFSSRSR